MRGFRVLFSVVLCFLLFYVLAKKTEETASLRLTCTSILLAERELPTPSQTAPEVLSDPFQLFNNIANVAIVTHPVLEDPDGPGVLFQWKPSMEDSPRMFHVQPRVRVLDYEGQPVAHRRVWVGAYPMDHGMQLQWDKQVVTDAEGYYQFAGLRAMKGSPRPDYVLVFACDGAPHDRLSAPRCLPFCSSMPAQVFFLLRTALKQPPPPPGKLRWGVGTKSEMAIWPLPSHGPTCGQTGYITPAVSTSPARAEQGENQAPTPASMPPNACLYAPQRLLPGILSDLSAPFAKSPVPSLMNQWKSMQWVVFIIFVALYPVFAANFPRHSPTATWALVAVALAVLVGGGVFTWYMYVANVVAAAAGPWVYAAVVMLAGSYVLLCAGVVALALALAVAGARPAWHDALWGMPKAREAYDYVQWLCTARVPMRTRIWREWQADRDRAFIVHEPPKALLRHIMPLRFLLAMGMCGYLICIFVLFTIYVWSEIQAIVDQLYNLVPNPETLYWEEQAAANAQVPACFDPPTHKAIA